jgi:hypothetical protein
MPGIKGMESDHVEGFEWKSGTVTNTDLVQIFIVSEHIEREQKEKVSDAMRNYITLSK